MGNQGSSLWTREGSVGTQGTVYRLREALCELRKALWGLSGALWGHRVDSGRLCADSPGPVGTQGGWCGDSGVPSVVTQVGSFSGGSGGHCGESEAIFGLRGALLGLRGALLGLRPPLWPRHPSVRQFGWFYLHFRVIFPAIPNTCLCSDVGKMAPSTAVCFSCWQLEQKWRDILAYFLFC